MAKMGLILQYLKTWPGIKFSWKYDEKTHTSILGFLKNRDLGVNFYSSEGS